MRIVFADTFYWIALLNTNGEDYKQVIQFGQANPNIKLVTTESVVDEVLNFFGSKGAFLRGRALSLSERIASDRAIQLVSHDADIRQAALTLYRDRLNKGYSFTQEGFTILFP